MNVMLFNADRTGYSIDQIRNPLTAGELIELLEEIDPNTPVICSHDSGYTYGTLSCPRLATVNEDGEVLDEEVYC